VATSVQIQAALAEANAADLSFDDMAKLLKRAIVNAIINGSGELALPWQTVGSDGTSIARLPLDAAQRLLDFCIQRASSGVVAQLAEFPATFPTYPF